MIYPKCKQGTIELGVGNGFNKINHPNCASCCQTFVRSYEVGYKKCFDIGYYKGYNKGVDDGYDEGYCDGHSDAKCSFKKGE